MNIDDQDRIIVTEYRGNKVAVFDTRTEKFTEYELPPRTYPYRANFDKNGEIWTGGDAHRPGGAGRSQDRQRRCEYLLPPTPTCARCSSTTRRRR